MGSENRYKDCAAIDEVGYEVIDVPEDLLCAVCNDLLTNPVQTACDHYFCSDCITRAFKSKKTCPICRTKDPKVEAASRLIKNMVGKQKIRCIQGDCEAEMLRDSWDAHTKVCPYSPVPCPNGRFGCTMKMQKNKLDGHAKGCEFKPKKTRHAVLNTTIDVERANRSEDVVDLPLKQELCITHRNALTFEFVDDDIRVLRPGVVSVSISVVARARDGWIEAHERYHGLGIQLNALLASYSLFPRRVKKGDCVSATITHHTEVEAGDLITFRIGMAAKKLIDDLQAKDVSIRWDSLE